MGLGSSALRVLRTNGGIYVLRMVTGAVIARVLGPNALGVWMVLALIPSYAEAVARLKADVAAVYYLGRQEVTERDALVALHAITLVTVSLVLLALVGWREPITAGLFARADVASAAYYGILLAIPLHFLGMNYAYLQLHLGLITAYNRQNTLKSVVPGLLAVLLLSTTSLRVGAMVVGMLVGHAAALIDAAATVHRRIPLRLTDRIDSGVIRRFLGFGGYLYVGAALEQLNQYVSALVVAIWIRPADVAFLRLAQDRVGVLDQIPAALGTVLYPRLSSIEGSRDASSTVARSCRMVSAALLIGGAMGAALAWPIVRVLYGSAYLPSVRAIWILVPGVVLLGSSAPITQYLYSRGRPGLVAVISGLTLAGQAVLLILLIPRFGFVGAALAVSLAFAISAACRVWVFGRVSPTDARSMLIPRRQDLIDVLRGALRLLRGRLAPKLA